MNPTIKHEKDNRKRIEYDAVGYIIDEDLAKTVENKVKDLVTDICNNTNRINELKSIATQITKLSFEGSDCCE